MKPPCCKTCLFSRWNLTKTGRIKRDKLGRCVVIVPTQKLPDSITDAYGYSPNLARRLMGPGEGTKCPYYEANDGKLMAIEKVSLTEDQL